MDNKNISLKNALSQLQEAIENQDFESAEALDSSIRQKIQQAIADASEGESKTELIDDLKNIQLLYSQLITCSEQSRAKLSGELKKITNESKAAKFYLNSSQYR
mgnify:CR=1 FL=1